MSEVPLYFLGEVLTQMYTTLPGFVPAIEIPAHKKTPNPLGPPLGP